MLLLPVAWPARATRRLLRSLGLRLIDFQLLKENIGGAELLYFIGNSLTPATRREHEADLLALYVSEMNKRGAQLELRHLLREYLAGFLGYCIMLVVSMKDTNLGSDRAKLYGIFFIPGGGRIP